MLRITKMPLWLPIVLLPSPAWAHADHGATVGLVSGFLRPFGGWHHLLAMIAVGLWSAQVGGRATWMLPGAFLSVVLSGNSGSRK